MWGGVGKCVVRCGRVYGVGVKKFGGSVLGCKGR